MHKPFSFKGPLTSLISSDSYCNLGIEAFSGGLSSDRTEFWAPCDIVGPSNWGYGVRLIRLCLYRLLFCLNSIFHLLVSKKGLILCHYAPKRVVPACIPEQQMQLLCTNAIPPWDRCAFSGVLATRTIRCLQITTWWSATCKVLLTSLSARDSHFIRYHLLVLHVCVVEMARATNGPVFGPSAKGFETFR